MAPAPTMPNGSCRVAWSHLASFVDRAADGVRDEPHVLVGVLLVPRQHQHPLEALHVPGNLAGS